MGEGGDGEGEGRFGGWEKRIKIGEEDLGVGGRVGWGKNGVRGMEEGGYEVEVEEGIDVGIGWGVGV